MRRFVTALVALAAGATPFVLASPAGAAITTPGDNTVVHDQPTVSGEQPVDGRAVDRVTVTLTPAGGGSSVSAVGCSGASCNGGRGTFSASFTLPVNGTYTAVATAYHDSRSALDKAASASSAPVTFGVEVAPAAPRRLVAEANGTKRTVTLSWTPNTEADLLGYQVFRGVDGSAPVQHGAPVDADTTTFVDDAGDGGHFTYQVVAIRRGASANSIVTSEASNSADATIDRAPSPTTTTTPAGASGGSGSSTGGTGGSAATGGTTGDSTGGSGGGSPGGLRPQTSTQPLRITPGAHLDLSGYQGKASPLAIGPAPTPTDPGFNETLPYQTPTTDADAEPGPVGRDEAALPVGSVTTTTTETNRRTLLGFLSGAMLLFMLSMHLRWLLRRTQPYAG